MKALRATALLLAAVTTTGGATPRVAAGVDPYFGDGGTSAFYRWDGPAAKPGTMLRQEDVAPNPQTPHAATIRRILYGSTDGRFGRGVVGASGLIYLPRGAPPRGGWPLLVWGHGTFGVADVCAPSWTGPTPRDAAYVDAWLAAGFVVVAPDYQGLGTPGVHPYLDRPSEGQSVLDAARAALYGYRDRITNRVVLAGQSQGSGAVLNATYLAPTYAPDVHIAATVATGLVWAAPEDAVKVDPVTVTPDGARVTTLRIASGGIRPDAPAPNALFTPMGDRMQQRAAHACSRDLVPIVKQYGITAQNAFTRTPEQMAAILLPLSAPLKPLRTPVFVGTGRADALIPPQRQYRAVRALCRAGTRVQWHAYDGITHNGSSIYALRDAIPFARSMLAAARAVPERACSELKDPGAPQSARTGVAFND